MIASRRALAVAAGVVVLTGCTAPQTTASSTKRSAPSPTATATASPPIHAGASLTPAPIPEATAGSTGSSYAIFVGASLSNAANYQVSIVRADGTVAASAQAARRGSQEGTPLPLVSTSVTRVYFLDGDASVKSLTPDGKTTTVAHLQASTSVHAAFAVSPDDRRIAVSTIDYSASPPRLNLYVEDLSGANHAEIFSSSSLYVWPVGWHAGKLVLAVGNAYPDTQVRAEAAHPWCDPSFGGCVADNPYAAVHGYHLVDPSNANRIATLGTERCLVIGLLTTLGSVCREGSFPGGGASSTAACMPTFAACMRVASWNGGIGDWISYSAIWIGVIAPDGNRMATCCNFDAINLYTRPSAGLVGTRLRNSAAPAAWVNNENLIFQQFNPPSMMILAIGGGTEVAVSAPGIPVASLPGGF